MKDDYDRRRLIAVLVALTVVAAFLAYTTYEIVRAFPC